MFQNEYERPVSVMLPCNSYERVDERTVTTLNIEEDISGRDVLTFTCPRCAETHRSLRLG